MLGDLKGADQLVKHIVTDLRTVISQINQQNLNVQVLNEFGTVATKRNCTHVYDVYFRP